MFNFTGFDGTRFSLPDLPSSVYYYNYFFIIRKGAIYKLICFNKPLSVEVSGIDLKFSSNKESPFEVFHTLNTSSSWLSEVNTNSQSFSSDFYFIYSSENLLEYRDLIVAKDFTLPIPETEVVLYTISPIIEEVNKNDSIVETVFNDIFGILPVLIVCLVSFIGLRKGISYLFSLLRHS